MSAKKFEKMIECIVNDDEAKAKALFHDIIVEKSRQIYESMMAEDQSMGLMDEIESEEQGMMEDEFETDEEISGDYDVEGGDEEFDMDSEEDEFDMDDEGMDDEGMDDGDEELEDRVVDLEDKLDQLMADFEAQMGDEDFGGDDEEMEVDSEEEFDDGDEEEFDDEEEVMESIELKKVSVTHGDNGVQTKSAVRANSGAQGMASKPVKFSGDTESVPTSASKPSNVYAKGETKMGSGMKNVDGAYKFNEKGDSAPKATKTSPAGTNTRSAVPESKRTTKKRI